MCRLTGCFGIYNSMPTSDEVGFPLGNRPLNLSALEAEARMYAGVDIL